MGTSTSRVTPQTQLETMNVPSRSRPRGRDLSPAQDKTALAESVFRSMLTRERRRAERSRTAFVLMLLDAKTENGTAAKILNQAVEFALITKRETDLVGWYMENAVLGIIFTGVNMEGNHPITEALRIKIETGLIEHLGRDRAAKVSISLHLFPESSDKNRSGWVADSKLYPDLNRKVSRRGLPEIITG